jgi:hypothetical protein
LAIDTKPVVTWLDSEEKTPPFEAKGRPTDLALRSLSCGVDPEAIVAVVCAISLRRLGSYDADELRLLLKRIFQAGAVLGRYGLEQMKEALPVLAGHDASFQAAVLFVPLARSLVAQAEYGFDEDAVGILVEQMDMTLIRAGARVSPDEFRARLAPLVRLASSTCKRQR